MKWRNWKLLMGAVSALIVLFWVPAARSVLLWILPLGSGIDDLVFFALVLLAMALMMIRVSAVKDKLRALARWLTK